MTPLEETMTDERLAVMRASAHELLDHLLQLNRRAADVDRLRAKCARQKLELKRLNVALRVHTKTEQIQADRIVMLQRERGQQFQRAEARQRDEAEKERDAARELAGMYLRERTELLAKIERLVLMQKP